MKMNEGNLDRILRGAIGLFIISLAFWGPKSSWAYLGLVPLLTGLFGICPLYNLLGITTCFHSRDNLKK